MTDDDAPAQEILAKITAAFEAGDAAALTELVYPEGQEAQRKYSESQVRYGLRVASAEVHPYQQPNWGIFRTQEFYPPPVWSISAKLALPDGRTTDRFYACAPDGGRWWICCYRTKERPPARRGKKARQTEVGVDFVRLREAVREGARKAFAEVRAAHPEERFYVFALYTDDGMMTIVPAANTEEGFNCKAGPDPEEANHYRWSTGEWAYEAVGDDHFRAASNLLNVPNRYPGEDDEGDQGGPGFDAFKAQAIETMIAALRDLDEEGIFGTGTDREHVTLFVSISDSDDAVAVENRSAGLLNPAPVSAKFAAR